MESKKQSTQLN
ncbi:BnaC05g12630D [Brassica napus]|uniref:BnaC05g12630D protein n=2 Tax=Brassica napus TaxID=3708 RepID=A0A078HQG8_BRANA|nr:BnaC05g12630D [Brassica napus]